MGGFYIAVEGPTDVGKTTLTARLARELDAVAVFDPFDANPFLGQLLARGQSDEALALRVELTFFALRVAQLREISGLLAADRTVVADWALLKQAVFAATTLGPTDTARVAATVEVWADAVPRPDVLIGLAAPTTVIRRRVRQRGRDMEAGVTAAKSRTAIGGLRPRVRDVDRSLIRLDAAYLNTFDDTHIHELAGQVRQLSIPLESR